MRPTSPTHPQQSVILMARTSPSGPYQCLTRGAPGSIRGGYWCDSWCPTLVTCHIPKRGEGSGTSISMGTARRLAKVDLPYLVSQCYPGQAPRSTGPRVSVPGARLMWVTSLSTQPVLWGFDYRRLPRRVFRNVVNQTAGVYLRSGPPRLKGDLELRIYWFFFFRLIIIVSVCNGILLGIQESWSLGNPETDYHWSRASENQSIPICGRLVTDFLRIRFLWKTDIPELLGCIGILQSQNILFWARVSQDVDVLSKSRKSRILNCSRTLFTLKCNIDIWNAFVLSCLGCL